ncbi:hypothetical protein K474DRAFT_1713913 [Panus rudis PR-1116 ss-1]|nr:hypothetical protein K474DRAFT_1713913 [Panus rudis PR-1116 ss-1]
MDGVGVQCKDHKDNQLCDICHPLSPTHKLIKLLVHHPLKVVPLEPLDFDYLITDQEEDMANFAFSAPSDKLTKQDSLSPIETADSPSFRGNAFISAKAVVPHSSSNSSSNATSHSAHSLTSVTGISLSSKLDAAIIKVSKQKRYHTLQQLENVKQQMCGLLALGSQLSIS